VTIGLTSQVCDRLDTGGTYRYIDQTPSPGTTECVCDDFPGFHAEGVAELSANTVRREVRIDGEQHRTGRTCVGAVDAGIGADKAVVGLGNYQVAPAA